MNPFSGRAARQFDLIALLFSRGVSAVASLAIIPLVLKSSGALAYGRFSLEYSGLLTVIALFGMVCVQPTYRAFDGSASEEPIYVRFAFLAAAAGGVAALIFGAAIKASTAEACLGGAMVFFQVLYTGLLTIRQIGAGARWYSLYEIIRGTVTLLPIGVLFWTHWPVDAAVAFGLLAASFAIGCALVTRPRISMAAWRVSTRLQPMFSGIAMGLWLALSSFTFVGVKLLARPHADAAQFANFAVVLDISSRVAGLIGSMVVVNYFPGLARAVREGSTRSVDVMLLEAFASNFVLTLIAGGAIAAGAVWFRWQSSVVGLVPAVIYASVVMFQTTMIAHKPLELSGRPMLLIGLFLAAQGAGFAVMAVTLRFTSIGLAAGYGIGAIGALYSGAVFALWNVRARALVQRAPLA